jgi:dipeptidyl aminopeptidase/acylaminoacyl peptidase
MGRLKKTDWNCPFWVTNISASFLDVLKVPVISAFYEVFDLTRDGKTLLYSTNRTGNLEFYRQRAKPGSKPVQLTKGKDPVDLGLFSPNGREIAFPKDRDGDETYHMYLLPIEGGKPRRITKTPQRMWGGFDWNPNGREVTRPISQKNSCGLETINTVNGECFMLMEPTPPITSLVYSHDGKYIACDAMVNPKSQEIRVFKRDDPSDTVIYSVKKDSRDDSPSFSPDDKRLAFASDAKGVRQIVIQGLREQSRQFLDLASGEEVMGQPVWGPKADRLFYIVSKHSRTVVREHKLTQRKGIDLPFPEGTISCVKVASDGSVAALHSSMTSPPAIYMRRKGSNSVLALTPQRYRVDLSKLATPRSVWYKSFDGRSIHAWYLPAASEARSSPAVVWVHGGPISQVFDDWIPAGFLRSLSLSGFGVIAPNFRGSTGYGAEFRKLNIGDLGGGDLEDVVYAAEWLRKQKGIQGGRIAVAGASYGGYMTLTALTSKPNVFAAGVAYVPFTDFIECYELEDAAFRAGDEELWGGAYAGKEKLIRSRSPITHISKIKAPVLIKAGKTDVRCPIQPLLKFVKRLREMDHPHEFILDDKAGHISSRCDWRENARQVSIMIDFLKKNLT